MSNKVLRAAIYCRVSTAEQDLENQIRQIEKLCEGRHWSIVERYQETAGGSRSDRAELRRMLADAHRRKFDVLVFWSLDRLSREGSYKTLGYLHTLSAAGVKWFSLQEPYIDSVGPFGDAIVGFLAAIASNERERLTERTRAGMARAKADGKSCGRPPVIVNLHRLRLMRHRGKSWPECSKTLKTSIGTLRKALALSEARLEGALSVLHERATAFDSQQPAG